MDILLNLVNVLASDTSGMVYIGIGLMAFGLGASGIGEGYVCGKTMEAMGRNPEMYSKLRTGYQIYKKALKKGVLLRPLGDVIYFNPPLIIEKADMDFVTDTALECLNEILGC